MRKKQRRRKPKTHRSFRPLDYVDPVVRSLRRELIRDYPRRLRSTASHEAAHCVAVAMLGLKVKSVSIVPDGEVLGRADYGHRPRHPNWIELFQEMVVNCAGNLGRALAIRATVEDQLGGEADLADNYDIASDLFGVPVELAEHWYTRGDHTAYAVAGTLRRAERVAHEMIFSPHGRIAVLLLTKALLERQVLTGEEAMQIIWDDTECLMMASYAA